MTSEDTKPEAPREWTIQLMQEADCYYEDVCGPDTTGPTRVVERSALTAAEAEIERLKATHENFIQVDDMGNIHHVFQDARIKELETHLSLLRDGAKMTSLDEAQAEIARLKRSLSEKVSLDAVIVAESYREELDKAQARFRELEVLLKQRDDRLGHLLLGVKSELL